MTGKKYFGKTPKGEEVYSYTFKNEFIELSILNLGGIIQRFIFKGADIVCGYDTAGEYFADNDYHGSIVGRYANRIADAAFTIDGVKYQLSRNDPWNNHMHGGKDGFNHKIWDMETGTEANGAQTVTLRYVSPDGEEGYPGRLDVKATYTLLGNEVSLRYEATTDKPTYVNMTNHSYLNIDGYDAKSVCDQNLLINADEVTVFDSIRIPTGEHLDVTGTPFDFREPHKIGERIDDDHPLLKITSGYGHNFCINDNVTENFGGRALKLSCKYYSPERSLTIFSDKPGLQVYSTNIVKCVVSYKGGVKQKLRAAICLEPQYEPNSCNRGAYLLRPGEKYDFMTVYRLD